MIHKSEELSRLMENFERESFLYYVGENVYFITMNESNGNNAKVRKNAVYYKPIKLKWCEEMFRFFSLVWNARRFSTLFLSSFLFLSTAMALRLFIFSFYSLDGEKNFLATFGNDMKSIFFRAISKYFLAFRILTVWWLTLFLTFSLK